jgi:hypothetical protein
MVGDVHGMLLLFAFGMFFQLRLLLLLSPQPTKAQVQTYKRIFQLQMKKHRRLQQIMITREGKRIN